MTPRDRRALVLGGVTLATAVLGLRVVPWAVGDAKAAHALLEEQSMLLARTRVELTTLPVLRDSTAILVQALGALVPRVLSGSTFTESAADLSATMNFAAARAPARLERLDVLPDSTVAGRLGRARVRASLETDVRGLVAFVRSIETNQGVLTVVELRVTAADPGSAQRGPEILKVEVTVAGWYIKARDTRDGK